MFAMHICLRSGVVFSASSLLVLCNITGLDDTGFVAALVYMITLKLKMCGLVLLSI